MEGAEQVKTWINATNRDPIVAILLDNSLMTKIQMETLLIEFFSAQMDENRTSSRMKAKMRVSRTKVSRGAYSRTLGQARRNVRKAVSTVLLLGYMGLLQTPELLSFVEVSNKIKSLVDLYAKYHPEYANESHEDIAKDIAITRAEIERTLMTLTRSRKREG
jgi:hypothetical protein